MDLSDAAIFVGIALLAIGLYFVDWRLMLIVIGVLVLIGGIVAGAESGTVMRGRRGMALPAMRSGPRRADRAIAAVVAGGGGRSHRDRAVPELPAVADVGIRSRLVPRTAKNNVPLKSL